MPDVGSDARADEQPRHWAPESLNVDTARPVLVDRVRELLRRALLALSVRIAGLFDTDRTEAAHEPAADLDTVSKRDVKGLYSRARKNEIADLIGFSPGAVYEAPTEPDLTLDTASQPPETSIAVLFEFIARELRDAGKRKSGKA